MIIPIIVSSGSGTCLWPLSRAARAAQFPGFGSPRSLLQDTLLRCQGDMFDPRPIVVGVDAHRSQLTQQVSNIEIAADFLLVPEAGNSCAAIAAGCLQALSRDPEAIVLVIDSDHFIPDAAAFGTAIREGLWDAELGFLVTFGVKPDRAATGYGYIAPGPELFGAGYGVARMIGTPDAETAERCFAEGCLWNSGNVLFEATTFLNELKRLSPEILLTVRQAFEHARLDAPFLRLDGDALARAPALSIDHVVMEKTARAAVLPVGSSWRELGGWSAAPEPTSDTPEGAAVSEGVIAAGLGEATGAGEKVIAELASEAQRVARAESWIK